MHRIHRNIGLVAAALALAFAGLVGCTTAAQPPTPTAIPTPLPTASPTPALPDEPYARILTADGRQVIIRLEVADTAEERAIGLSKRSSLPESVGMIFVYLNDHRSPFWMKDTWIPLSIAFLAADGRILEIQDMEPNTTETHQPAQMYRNALEVNRGFFEKNGVNVGDSVELRLGGK